VSLVSIFTVSPIIPSIEPDKTSFTASVIDDEASGELRVGRVFGDVTLSSVFGDVTLGCALISPLVVYKTKLMRVMR